MKKANLFFVVILTLLLNFSLNATQVQKQGVKTTVALIDPNDDDYYYGYPQQHHNIGGSYQSPIYEKCRTIYQFDISDIPPNSIITNVSSSYNFSRYSSHDCKITFADPETNPQSQYWEISNSSVLFTLTSYSSSSSSSTTLKNDLIANLGSSYYYLGAYSPQEYTGDSDSQLDLFLTITYTPIVEITVKNIFNGGTVKVDGITRQSPYTFLKNVGTTLSIEAIEQTYDSYYRLWNDTEAPENRSKWLKWISTSSTEISDSKTHSFTVTASDEGTELEAGLRKQCRVIFENGTGAGNIKVNGSTYSSPAPTKYIVEANSITGQALNHQSNGIDFTFESWSDNGGTSPYVTFYPSGHEVYTANFEGRPNNYYRNQRFNPKVVGQPIKVYWDQHPNTSVTHYKVYRKPKFGSESCVGTFSRTGDLNYVYCFTDPTYSHTNDNSTTNLLMYDVRAYYAPDGNYADYDFRTTYGEIEAIAANGDSEERKEVISYEYSVSNYPNPYNPSTTINYSIKDAGNVQIVVYDVLGRRVIELVNEVKESGSYKILFDGSKLSNGVYYYMMKSGGFVQTKKMILMK